MGASPRPSLALIAAGAAAAGLAPAGGCYDLYTPDCGFYCSADGACPDGYTCSAADHRCRRDGSEPTLACPGPDGFVDRAPVVVFTMPRADAIGVPERSVITVAFSKPVDNVTGSTFVVELGASPVAGVVDFAPGDTVATFIPAAPFELATPYHARLDRAIHDFRGLPLIPYDWTFTVDGRRCRVAVRDYALIARRGRAPHLTLGGARRRERRPPVVTGAAPRGARPDHRSRQPARSPMGPRPMRRHR